MTDIDFSEFARQLALKRKRVEKVCPVCGTMFIGRSDQVYDKLKCKTRALRARKKDARAAQEQPNQT